MALYYTSHFQPYPPMIGCPRTASPCPIGSSRIEPISTTDPNKPPSAPIRIRRLFPECPNKHKITPRNIFPATNQSSQKTHARACPPATSINLLPTVTIPKTRHHNLPLITHPTSTTLL
ncbi:hypothetical protein DSO57_1017238 [Entomophthora muscae]|uniref:Uncharacterized protein n=1 Tax=Entomophthora muscae TaxID=34485 RepID=A0ACC2STD5_9FUNG|nr:hypothetical protein DSO57_1017238 [Entomophthora muscae]